MIHKSGDIGLPLVCGAGGRGTRASLSLLFLSPGHDGDLTILMRSVKDEEWMCELWEVEQDPHSLCVILASLSLSFFCLSWFPPSTVIQAGGESS